MNEALYGKARVSRIIDLDPFPIPFGFIFPDADIEAIVPHHDSLGPDHVDFAVGTALLAIQSHLIRFAGKTILLDACVGEHKQRPLRADWHRRAETRYIANLAACGCSPDDIDIVMCTHLHADHVGWNTRLQDGEWVPTFRNARYLMSQIEIDSRAAEVQKNPAANHGSYQDSVLPVIERGLVDTVKAGDSLVDDAVIIPLPGHAPGQIGLDLAVRQDEHIIFCGDAIHNPAQVYRPEWSSAFCHNRVQAVQSRRWLLEQAASGDVRLVPSHLRAAAMRVEATASGFVPRFER